MSYTLGFIVGIRFDKKRERKRHCRQSDSNRHGIVAAHIATKNIG